MLRASLASLSGGEYDGKDYDFEGMDTQNAILAESRSKLVVADENMQKKNITSLRGNLLKKLLKYLKFDTNSIHDQRPQSPIKYIRQFHAQQTPCHESET